MSGTPNATARSTRGAGQEHAGHTVKLTGEFKGDAITVSKIEMPATYR